jgi:hypothetical protein
VLIVDFGQWIVLSLDVWMIGGIATPSMEVMVVHLCIYVLKISDKV